MSTTTGSMSDYDTSIQSTIGSTEPGLNSAEQNLNAAGASLNPNDPASLLQYQEQLTMFENEFQTVSSIVSGLGNLIKSMTQNIH